MPSYLIVAMFACTFLASIGLQRYLENRGAYAEGYKDALKRLKESIGPYWETEDCYDNPGTDLVKGKGVAFREVLSTIRKLEDGR